MEYLSRVLSYTTSTMPFRFHPLYAKLKLCHLMFADDLLLFSKGDIDDLLLFSKGDIGSIMKILRSFATFSCASGLQMNNSKTNAYFNGVLTCVKKDILQATGFIEGQLPFRYLGVIITCGKIKKSDCNILIEKTISRIRSFRSKKLAYAGRFILFNSVPKVSWDKVCAPKQKGGLGIRDSQAWNLATIGKLVWWIYCSPDRLWVKWISQIYLKGVNLSEYSLNVKVILSAVDMHWHPYIWNSLCLPNHQFMGWLIAREAIVLKDRLCRLGVAPDDYCLICGIAAKTPSHLYQECEYSKQIFEEMARLCGVLFSAAKFIQWITTSQISTLEKGVILCLLLAAQYHIWMQRNKARVEGCIMRPEVLCQMIKREVKIWL
ncbi:uncharacterized protein LOC141588207 [Silene latifolia]|uniref:uncharacterized protein LOC141588207 n=1 Tax=Silene latifolia TaxID=37657 RepID=UPI003D77A086